LAEGTTVTITRFERPQLIKATMSSLAALFALSCGSDYEPTPEEIEAQRKYMEEQKEREKHTIFNLYQFQALARVEAEGGGKLNWIYQKNLILFKRLIIIN
jgi:hypothetical protein